MKKMEPQYSIVFSNNSRNPGSFCVFQKPINISVPNISTVAWFAQLCNPETSCIFTWSLDYCYCWGAPGFTAPGVSFFANQIVPADLVTQNLITLDYNSAFLFTSTEQGPIAGTLSIAQTNNVPFDKGYVGIGMSGSCTNVVPAQPNLTLTFTPNPTPTYYVLFDQVYPNQLLSEQQVSQSVPITFLDGQYIMYVNINGRNQIQASITPFT